MRFDGGAGPLSGAAGGRRTSFFDRLSRRIVFPAALVGLGAATGVTIARMAGTAGDSLPKMLLPPIAMACGLWFFIDPTSVFFAVMLSRASIDTPFAFVKFGTSGVGAIYNAAMIGLLAWFVFRNPRRFFTFVLPLWAPFVLVCALGVARSPDRAVATKTFLVVCSCMAVFSIPLCMEKLFDLRACRRLVLGASVFPALYGFLEKARGGGQDGGRIMSTFLHENIFAFFLTLNLALAFMALMDPKGKLSGRGRLAIGFWSLILLVLLGLTGTRSAWAGCAFFFIAYGLVLDRKFIVYLALAGVVLFLLPPVQDRLGELFVSQKYVSSFDQVNSFAWRLNMWRLGLGYLRPQDYLLGRGLDSFFYYSLTFNPLNYNQNGAHSIFVQTIFELGAIGFACAAWLFFNIFRVLVPYFRQNRYEAFTLIAVVLMYLFFGFGDNLYNYLAFNWYFALVVGTGCAMALAVRSASVGAPIGAPVAARPDARFDPVRGSARPWLAQGR